jgi:hypothetical protein
MSPSPLCKNQLALPFSFSIESASHASPSGPTDGASFGRIVIGTRSGSRRGGRQRFSWAELLQRAFRAARPRDPAGLADPDWWLEMRLGRGHEVRRVWLSP